MLQATACMILSLTFASETAENREIDWAKRFLAEAPAAWEEYGRFTEKLQGRVTHKATSNGRVVVQFTAEFKSNGRCRLILNRDEVGDDGSIAWACNPTYEFSVRRRTDNSSWTVDTASAFESKAAQDERQEATARHLRTLIQVYHGYEFSKLVRRPDFKVLEARPRLVAGREYVEITFDNTHELDRKDYCPILSGKLLLDPDHHWCALQWEFQVHHLGGRGSVVGQAEVREHGEYLLPRRIVDTRMIDLEDPGGATMANKTTYEQDYDLSLSSEELPDDEFTLSAFGLPEPWDLQQAAKKPTRWFLWLTLAGVAFLAVGAFFYYRARRRA